jgi:arabinofuranosyltransferase
LYAVAISFGLAFLTRNDLLLLAIPIFGYLYFESWNNRKSKNAFLQLVFVTVIFGTFVVGQTIFRLVYYGDTLPNTYYLKVSQIPILVRINDGLLYSLYFLKYSFIVFILAIANLFLNPSRRKLVLFCLPIIFLLYQTWTGGDVYNYWRFTIPVMPIVIIFASGTIVHLIFHVMAAKKNNLFYGEVMAIMLVMIVVLSPFRQMLAFQDAVTQARQNKNNMDTAIAISELTDPGASIGVYTAGLISYYTGRYSIDFLGKSDPYIARTYPHLPSKIKWFEKITAPGHNKYDLAYSIKRLQPDYVQRFHWARVNIRNWALDRYIKVEYQGQNGTKTIHLKKDSPFIVLEKGKVVPWGK